MSTSSQASLPVDRSSHIGSSMQVLLDVGTLGGLTDGQLLERFLRGRTGRGRGRVRAPGAAAWNDGSQRLSGRVERSA